MPKRECLKIKWIGQSAGKLRIGETSTTSALARRLSSVKMDNRNGEILEKV